MQNLTNIWQNDDGSIQIGALYSSSAGNGISMNATTRAFTICADDAGVALSGSRRAILGRMLFSTDQTSNVSMRGVMGQVKFGSGVDTSSTGARVFGLEGYIELAGNSSFAGQVGAVRAYVDANTGNITVASSSYLAGVLAELRGTGTNVYTGKAVAFMAKTTDNESGYNKWEYGLYVPPTAAHQAILIGDSITSCLPVSATYQSAVEVFATDGAVAIASGNHISAIRARMLLEYTGTKAQEGDGIRGQMVCKVGGKVEHNLTAVLGSFEVSTTALAFSGATTNNNNYQAGVVGRMAIGVASCTLDAYARVAGVMAVRGSTSAPTVTSGGVLAGFIAKADYGAEDWLWGMYLEDCKQGIYASPSYGALTSGEVYGINIAATVGAMTGGTSYVAGNFVATANTAGSGTWLSGVFGKATATADSDSPVLGYLSGGEFECTLAGSQNPPAHFAIVANMTDTTTGVANEQNAWIAIRDYGTANRSNNLLWFGTEITIGTNSDTVLVTSVNADKARTHAIKILVGSTTMWLMATTHAPSAS